MACKSWNPEWIAHLYGELGSEQEAALSAHLPGCASCRATLDEAVSTRRVLRDAAPVVPGVPRVVLGASARHPAWFFAAGVVSAALLAGTAFVTLPRRSSPATFPALAEDRSGADREAIAGLESTIHGLEARLARLESRPSSEPATQAAISKEELRLALDQLTRRFDRERERDLESVVRAITATELRTSTWLDQARETVHLLALRQDPRFTEN